MIIPANGSIFESNADVLINTVNCVGVMGKGLALQFKERYPVMFESYAKACKNREVHIGTMQYFRCDEQNITIINFPTKKHWKDPSTYEYIVKGMHGLINILNSHVPRMSVIAIPALGCTNGGLNYNIVQQIIRAELSYIERDFDFLLFPPFER